METITFKDIQEANDTIKTTNIKGKEYAEVNQRIKAFRMIYPTGIIETEMLSNDNGVCIFKAMVGYREGTELYKLATGTAYEKEDSTFINKTSYIENCETSAVGRALGMCGFGIDTSVASAEEVQNAIQNQVTITTEEEARALELTFGKYKGETIGELVDREDSYINYLFQNGTPDIKQAITILTGIVDHTPEETKDIVNAMPIQETQIQRLKDEIDRETIKLYLQSVGKAKVSELTYEEANKLLED